MNIFRFLKSTTGAIKPLNALIISGAAGAIFAYTVNTSTQQQIKAERQIRSLTSISQTAPQAGMHRRGDLLTSINVRDGLNQVATAEERAAMQDNSPLARYQANQRALETMGSTLDKAAQFDADSELKLNVNHRDVVDSPTRFSVGNPNAARQAQIAGANAGAAAQAAGQSQLASASMARASGNAFNATSGGINSTAAGGTRASAEGPKRMSGSMPGGSNIVSQMGLDGATARANSSFNQGRNARSGRGSNAGGDRSELKDILKKSAAADANANASNTEGARAFLANGQISGGVTVDGNADQTTGASSADLAAKTNRKLKAVGNHMKKVEDDMTERKKAQKKLVWQLIATVVGSIGVIIAASKILAKLTGAIRWIVAGAMIAVVTAANAWLMANAIKFANKYSATGGIGIAKVAIILAPIMVGAMVFTAIKPTGWRALGKTIWENIKSTFGPTGLLGMAKNSLFGLFK